MHKKMAAVVVGISLCRSGLPRLQSIPAVIAISHKFQQCRNEHSEVTVKKFPPPGLQLAALRRGTGGRSSFSGVVATVFGAGGFLGRYLVNKLGKLGTQVIIPYRGDPYAVLRLKLCGDLGQILFQPFNLKDEELLYKAMKYSNVVINLIGRDYETSNFPFDEVHVKGARNIARIARECGVKKLIHLSALNAAEKPNPVILKKGSQFLSSKWRGEQAVREEFPEAIIFRPSDIFGHEDRFLRYYAHNWRKHIKLVPLWKMGRDCIKQPVFVSDVAKGIVNAVFDDEADGKIYQAVGPRRYELGELVDYIHRVMRKGPEWGYLRTDMRFDPVFWAKVIFTEMFFWKYPVLSWERVEREHVSDTLTPGLPTLEDLGVQLTPIEDRAAYDLKPFRAYGYYTDTLGEFPDPEPPKVVQT